MAKNVNIQEINTYWQNRAEKNYIAGEKEALKVARNLKNLYNRANKEIEETINAFYGKYASQNGLTLEEARQVLDKTELKDFKSYIKELLKYGDKQNFSPEEMYEYKRLYNKAKITRLEKLQANIQTELDKLANKTQNEVGDLLYDSYENGYYKTIYDNQMEFGIDNAFTGLNKKAIEKAVNTKYQKSNYSDRIWTSTNKLMQTLTQEIPRGIVLGYNPRKLAKQVSKKLDTNYNNTVRLIRTEYSRILNQATIDGYKQAGIKQYQISTTLDNRRCDDCADFEGKIVDIDEAIEGIDLPPFHPNCRCTTIPVIKEYEAVIEDENLKKEDIGFITYEDWKNGLVKLEDNKVIYKKGIKFE